MKLLSDNKIPCLGRVNGVCSGAIVRVSLSDGCLAYPDDHEQDLCVQHLHSIEPRGSMEIIKVYDQDTLDWYRRSNGLPR